MRRYLLFLIVGVILLGFSDFASAQCPEDTLDLGDCDTLHVVAWDAEYCDSFPCLVHVSLLVTHDSNAVYHQGHDSIMGFTLPLAWIYTNSSAYCSLTSEKNNWQYSDTENGIFRHFGGKLNRLFELYEMGKMWVVSTYIFNPSSPDRPGSFGLGAFCGSASQAWWEGQRVLLATWTFTVSDTMTVCIYEPITPPGDMVWFYRIDWVSYRPRYNMPFYMTVKLYMPGDANGDGVINSADLVYLINYLFKGGPAPKPLQAGDVNCDEVINSADIVYLIDYLFKAGPAPLDCR